MEISIKYDYAEIRNDFIGCILILVIPPWPYVHVRPEAAETELVRSVHNKLTDY